MYIKVTLPGLRYTYIRTFMATLYIDMNFSILIIYTVCMCYIVHICTYIHTYIHMYIDINYSIYTVCMGHTVHKYICMHCGCTSAMYAYM